MSFLVNYLSTVESCYFVNYYGLSLTALVKGQQITLKNKDGQIYNSIPIDLKNRLFNYHNTFN